MSAAYLPSQRASWAEGQPISDLMARALANPQLISLAAGFVDQQTLPVDETRAALDALWRDPEAVRAALQYGTTPGFPPLRAALLDRILAADFRGRSPDLSVEQIVVTAGSNQLLHLVVESLLDPGDIVLCAAPTYLVFLGTLGNSGGRSVGVATDGHGMIPEALVDTLQRLEQEGELPRVKAIYLVPYFDNPAGTTLPLPRREAILEIAKRWSRQHTIHVISDDAYRELRYEGEDELGMRGLDDEGNTVIVAGTFSKSFSPGIRVGWGVLPRHLVQPVCNQKGNIDFGSPNFSQHLMAGVVGSDLFDRHVARLRESYADKLHAMLAAAKTHLASLPGVRYERPRGGLYVWLTLPDDIPAGPSGRLFDEALREGVLYVPGQFCYPKEGEPVHKNTIRLSFGVQSCDKIQEGIAALARALVAVRNA